MAITINYLTKVISVPKADTQLVQSVPTEIRQLDIDLFRLTLKDLEDDEDGMPFLDTHNHTPPITVGSVTLARVVEIINGYTVTFEDGQYAVNLVSANSNIADVTNVNQVSIRSANSAGLTFSKQIENTAFGGDNIWVDYNVGKSGTLYPRGTSADPTATFEEADVIRQNRRLPKKIHLAGDGILTATGDVSEYTIVGEAPVRATMTVTAGALNQNVALIRIGLSGDLTGRVICDTTVLFGTITGFEGVAFESFLSMTTLKLAPSTGLHEFIRCIARSLVPGINPIIDCDNLDNLDIRMVELEGDIDIINFSDASNSLVVDLHSGTLILGPTCTEGTVRVKGLGNIIDGSGTNCTVDSSDLINPSVVSPSISNTEKMLRNRFITEPSTGVATLYDDDNVTPLFTGQLFEDAAGTQKYRGKGAERRERLQ